jgi:hypothetical protein
MQKNIRFQSIPSLAELRSQLAPLAPPFSVEIRQGVVHGPGCSVDRYCEFIDCETVAELHDFLCDDECGVSSNEPFTIDVMDDNEPVGI